MDQVSIISELSITSKVSQPEIEPKNKDYTTLPEMKHNKKTAQTSTQDKTHNDTTGEDKREPNTNSRANVNTTTTPKQLHTTHKQPEPPNTMKHPYTTKHIHPR